jgi:hypothetical protein
LKTSAPVDVVMMLMGTNDVWRGRNVATSMGHFEKSLAAMKAAKVKQLVVSHSLPLSHSFLFSPFTLPTANNPPILGRKDPTRATFRREVRLRLRNSSCEIQRCSSRMGRQSELPRAQDYGRGLLHWLQYQDRHAGWCSS